MKSSQTSRLKMYIAVRDFLTRFATIFNALPNAQALLTALQNVINKINDSGEIQSLNRNGITENKNLLRQKLVDAVMDHANKLYAWAKFNHNLIVMYQTNYVQSDIERLVESDLRNTAQNIYDLAQTHLTDLTEYQITAASQTAFQTDITNYEASLSQRRLGTAEQKKATQQLEKSFEEADGIINDLDALIETVRKTQIDFYNGYKVVSNVISSSRTAAIKGKAIDSATGLPLRNVILIFTLNDGLDGTAFKISKRTGLKGGYLIKSAPEGKYDAVAILPGCKNIKTSVNVVNGILSRLDFRMEKE